MTNHASGHYAEKVAARWLQARGYKIYALNWRDRRAEIDIVAGRPDSGMDNAEQGAGAPVFVEVKYRRSAGQGSGLDYITPSKLRQMRFAAELWAAQCNYTGGYALAAIELSGPDYAVTEFLPEIS